MKYIAISIATLVLMACVCGGAATTPTIPPIVISTATAAPNTIPAPTDTPPDAGIAKVGDTVTQGDYSVTVVSMETAPSYNAFLVAESGNVLLAVEVIVQSGASTGVNVSFLDVKVKDADGFEYTVSLGGKEPSLPTQDDLPKGDKVRGWVTIEIPEQAKGLILIYEPLLNFDSNVAIRFDLGR